MSSGFHPGSFRPVSGLGGVRAVSGLGCGCQQQQGLGSSVAELMTSPVFLTIAGVVVVGGGIIIWELVREG